METPMVGWRLGAMHEDVGLAVKRRSFGSSLITAEAGHYCTPQFLLFIKKLALLYCPLEIVISPWGMITHHAWLSVFFRPCLSYIFNTHNWKTMPKNNFKATTGIEPVFFKHLC
jgi:hypothetical protein